MPINNRKGRKHKRNEGTKEAQPGNSQTKMNPGTKVQNLVSELIRYIK